MNTPIKYFLSGVLIPIAIGIGSCVCFAQTPEIDSLILLLKTDKSDTTKLIHLYQISDESETVGNFEDGLNYGNQALQLADLLLGNADVTHNDVVTTAKRYKAKAYSNIGIIYDDQGNHPLALQNHFASLKIMEEINDKKGIATSMNNIGIIYDKQKNYSEALKNYLASLEIKKALGDKKGIASAYNNIGVLYYSQGNLDDALENYLAGLKIKEALDDKRGIAFASNNIGNVYTRQAELENIPELRSRKRDQALKVYHTAMKLFEETGNKAGLASCYTNLGDFFLKDKKYNQAEDYLLKSKLLAQEVGNKYFLIGALESLTELDSARGNYHGAYENYKLYILYRDSLDNEETRKKTIQNQMTYDFEKKEAVAQAEHKKELENQELIAVEKSRKQKIVLALVSCFLLLVVVFAGFIFRSLRITRKQKNIIEEQKSIVERQKMEVENQKAMVEEHQKSIIDSITYARRIQRSLLPTETYIERNMNRLKKK